LLKVMDISTKVKSLQGTDENLYNLFLQES